MIEPISALIVDDSALIRNMVRRFFDTTPDIQVAATAMNGIFALNKIETHRVDIIILDLEMPKMNGIEFLKERQKRGIGIPVIILSSLARSGARITMKALSLGAADFLLKPSGSDSEQTQDTREQLIQLVRSYGREYRNRREHPAQKKPAKLAEPGLKPISPIKPERDPGPIEIIALGVSTGGPNALRKVLPKLDKSLSAPILVVQHMPAGFTEEFAGSLNEICALEIKEAEDGDVIKPGRILIAPGNRHMNIESKPLAKVARLTDSPPVNGHRPSVDVLFRSVSRIYENRCLAIIMTGMGKDGVAEIGSIFLKGGLTLAQDESSSVVFGMPRIAIEKGYIHKVVSVDEIAEMINTLTREYSV